ncbi:hypothetical protein LPJ60_002141 [Coemansia sp. RSA 2675]|uniref:Uncharacterized protein n=1 Tax=Coemansia linderi TaxID=2663919 RepID=A0ACC1KJT4_9FUNG|nr:hypothetical protein LPJ60_002141 [Coemansia sp. RSA 2675]KAJ2416449.1 hypothetical protein GGI10_000956 [Coemansia sp. RSA 2530]KAJ2790937.1 hypothetical protein GGI18_001481 [Coemansia linderi]
MVDGNNTFEERDWKLETAKYTLGGAGIGMLASAFQTAYAPTKTGSALDMFGKYGGTIAFMAAMGGVFAGVDAAAAQIRGKDDYKNSAIAGCAAGLIAGARQRSIPAALGSCAFFAASMATYEYSGGFEGAMHGMTREQRDEYRAGIFASAADLRK